MSNVILMNRTKRPRRMLVLNLTKAVAAIEVTNTTTDETRQGERRKRVSSKLVPDSIRIPSGGQLEVSERTLSAPDVKAAIARRDIVVKRAPSEVEAQVEAQKVADQKSRSEAWAKKKAAAQAAAAEDAPKTRRKKNGGVA